MRLAALAAAFVVLAGPAFAQDPWQPKPANGLDPATDLSLRLGVGGMVAPDYDGSDDYELKPWPIISLEFLRLPGLGEFGGPSTGFSIGPSFNVVGEREDSDNAALVGLGDVDMAIELGGKVGYETETFEVFAALRHGFGGHHGIVGDLGLNAILHPMDRLTVKAGPRASFADGDYFDTYFSVTPFQSAASGLPVHDAGSGFKDVGLEAEITYDFTEKLRGHLEGGWSRLVGDAADSPIVAAAGDENQFHVGVGVSYRLDLDLFD